MGFSRYFLSAVRIAAQLLPVTSALARWLSEIETSRLVERLDRLDDPLIKYGLGAKNLSQILYSLVQSQPQDIPTTHVDWTPELAPLIKELRHFEADGLITGSHAVTGEFKAGLRLNRGFIVYLALIHRERRECEKLVQLLENAKGPLNGRDLKKSINLPLTVIDAFFQEYENMGQGFKSKEIGSSTYIPKPEPRS
jgi:hypothetical protein